MTAKIDSLGASVIGLAGAPKAAAAGAANAGQASATPAAAVDKVSLTSDGVRMQQLTQAASGGAAIDQAKVSRVRAAISSGQYTPDPQRIAGKLARMEWDLGG